jgi:hypothetical protein
MLVMFGYASMEKKLHDAHRKAAEQHDLAAHAHRTAAEHNEKGKTSSETGICSGLWSTRITLTNWQEKRIPSQGR